MQEGTVLIKEQAHGIVTVTLNRPDALNALTADMMTKLATAFQQLSHRDDVKVIILTGAGRAFCAGVDLTAASTQTHTYILLYAYNTIVVAVFQNDQIADENSDPVAQMAKYNT